MQKSNLTRNLTVRFYSNFTPRSLNPPILMPCRLAKAILLATKFNLQVEPKFKFVKFAARLSRKFTLTHFCPLKFAIAAEPNLKTDLRKFNPKPVCKNLSNLKAKRSKFTLPQTAQTANFNQSGTIRLLQMTQI